jgi:hypothetical protein
MRDFFWNVFDNRWGVLAFAVGTTLGLLGLSTPLWLATPDIQPGPPSSSVLLQSFKIKNPSLVFSISNLEVRCTPDVRTRSGAGISRIGLTMFARGHLSPGETGSYVCPVPFRFSEGDGIVQGTMQILLEYDSVMPARDRLRDEVLFTLDTNATPQQWLPGKRLR